MNILMVGRGDRVKRSKIKTERKPPTREDVQERVDRSEGCTENCIMNHDVLPFYLLALDMAEAVEYFDLRNDGFLQMRNAVRRFRKGEDEAKQD